MLFQRWTTSRTRSAALRSNLIPSNLSQSPPGNPTHQSESYLPLLFLPWCHLIFFSISSFYPFLCCHILASSFFLFFSWFCLFILLSSVSLSCLLSPLWYCRSSYLSKGPFLLCSSSYIAKICYVGRKVVDHASQWWLERGRQCLHSSGQSWPSSVASILFGKRSNLLWTIRFIDWGSGRRSLGRHWVAPCWVRRYTWCAILSFFLLKSQSLISLVSNSSMCDWGCLRLVLMTSLVSNFSKCDWDTFRGIDDLLC